jgi:hypothetical protein
MEIFWRLCAIYIQILRRLRTHIVSGRLDKGSLVVLCCARQRARSQNRSSDHTTEGTARVRQKGSIRDVAAEAGVSHHTVSRVINIPPDVAEKTRHRLPDFCANDVQPQPDSLLARQVDGILRACRSPTIVRPGTISLCPELIIRQSTTALGT